LSEFIGAIGHHRKGGEGAGGGQFDGGTGLKGKNHCFQNKDKKKTKKRGQLIVQPIRQREKKENGGGGGGENGSSAPTQRGK